MTLTLESPVFVC